MARVTNKKKAVARTPSKPKDKTAETWAAPQRGGDASITSHERAMLLTRREIAHLFDTTPGNVTNWVKKGCPVTDYHDEKSRERYYNANHVLRWAMEHVYGDEARSIKRGATKEDLRIKTLRADQLELTIRQSKGELAPFRSLIERYVDAVAACKSKLLSLPTRIAPRVVRMTKQVEVQRECQLIVEEALRELGGVDKADLLPEPEIVDEVA